MLTRIITGVVMLLCAVPIIMLSDTYLLVAVCAALSFIGMYEMMRCLGYSKNYFLTVPTCLLSALIPFMAKKLLADKIFLFNIAIIVFFYMIFLFVSAMFSHGKIKFSDVAQILMLSVYISTGFTSMLSITTLEYGRTLFILIFVGAFSTDVFAYFTGVLFGRHKLLPDVSPKKTVEGAVGGIAFATLAVMLYGFIVGKILDVSPNYCALAVVGFMISVISQVGDLILSVIKREHNVKDYGRVFPGHGGVLDRFDSAIAVSPLLYILSLGSNLFKLFF